MRSPKPPFVYLLDKECRELISSRSWWVLLFGMGPLVGVSFISSMRAYAEVSGLNGTSAGVGEALSPLIGVWAPTFSACELAAVFLLPFVAIRLVAGDRQSGALKLELQQAMSPFARILTKSLVLLGGWLLAMLPAFSAILLWNSYGGSVYPPELITLVAGHMLNAGLTIGLAAAMSSLSEHPSTAAILTLGVTVGAWIVSFFAAIRGGWWERVAGYTPAAMVSEFQHGLARLDTILISLALIFTGLGLAAIWMRLGVHPRRKVAESIAIGVLATAAVFACTFVTPNWDTSESRGNSFSKADERALRHIHKPIRIEACLAPEDPRRVDLEHRALSKLRRILPKLKVQYSSATSIGLFEQTREGYGEIWYDVEGRRAMTRATTPESVLENIYTLAGVQPPAQLEDESFRGHPLAVPPKGAGALFYGFWPGLVLAAALVLRWRSR